MPGPGGGSHGGGFGGGSFRGGGGGGWHRSSSFGGPMFFFGPRFGCGGCLGWLFAPIAFTVISIIILIAFIMVFIGGLSGEHIIYEETTYQDYANDAYMDAFGEGNEDGILILITTNDAADGYYAIAWIGDNIKRDVNLLFGDEYTAFGAEMFNQIGDKTYKYSLDTDLAYVMEAMKDKVLRAAPSGAYRGNAPTAPHSYLDNRSEDVDINNALVEEALVDFTAATGIPCVIILEDVNEVFKSGLDFTEIVILIVLLLFVAAGIFAIVKAIRQRRSGNGGFGNGNNGGYNGGYNNNGGYDHW